MNDDFILKYYLPGSNVFSKNDYSDKPTHIYPSTSVKSKNNSKFLLVVHYFLMYRKEIPFRPPTIKSGFLGLVMVAHAFNPSIWSQCVWGGGVLSLRPAWVYRDSQDYKEKTCLKKTFLKECFSIGRLASNSDTPISGSQVLGSQE